MDEPLGALDALTREKLMGLIDHVWRQTQTTLLYITHNVSEAVFLADRVIVLKADPGEVVLDLEIDLQRPRDALSPAPSSSSGACVTRSPTSSATAMAAERGLCRPRT